MNAFQTALQQNAAPKQPASKKSAMPIINIVGKDNVAAIEGFVDAQTREKKAKADKEFAASVIRKFVRKQQDERALAGDFNKSYQVKTAKHTVKFVTADKFSINGDDAPEFKRLFSSEFDSLMEEKIDVTLKPAVFADEDKQNELMNLLGDKFSEFFDVTTTLHTKKGFDEEVYKVAKTQDKLDEIRVYAKQQTPSIR